MHAMGKAEDCGQCNNCLDKKKFGGPGKKKKGCIKRSVLMGF